MPNAYSPPADRPTCLPGSSAASALLTDFLSDRLGRANLDHAALAELRRRGLSPGRVWAAVARLVDAGRLTARSVVGGIHLQLTAGPDPRTPAPPARRGPRFNVPARPCPARGAN